MPRPIRAAISAGALAHNLRVARDHAGGASIWAVIKANAYGHGLERAARAFDAADGFAVLDFLKEHQPRMLPSVLIVTAALSENELGRARSYGVCGVVTKPFDIETLLGAVKDCVTPDDGRALGPVLCSSGPVILLLADLLRQRLM